MDARMLSKEESAEIERLSNLAQVRLGIKDIDNFENVLDKIKVAIDQVKEDDDIESLGYELGSLYG